MGEYSGQLFRITGNGIDAHIRIKFSRVAAAEPAVAVLIGETKETALRYCHDVGWRCVRIGAGNLSRGRKSELARRMNVHGVPPVTLNQIEATLDGVPYSDRVQHLKQAVLTWAQRSGEQRELIHVLEAEIDRLRALARRAATILRDACASSKPAERPTNKKAPDPLGGGDSP